MCAVHCCFVLSELPALPVGDDAFLFTGLDEFSECYAFQEQRQTHDGRLFCIISTSTDSSVFFFFFPLIFHKISFFKKQIPEALQLM